MIRNCLPPSPNWYSGKVSSINEDGLLAYASRNAIVLVDVNQNVPKFVGNLHGHEERVACVLFCRSPQTLCASCSDDKSVKVWDTTTRNKVEEHIIHQGKVTSQDWNYFEPEVLVSSDDKGCIVQWNYVTGEAKQWIPETTAVSSISCSPVNANHLVVGYKNGDILVLDLSQWKDVILYRLRGHDDEVTSLLWFSSQPNAATSQVDASRPSDELNLLSGGKDRSIKLWDCQRENAVSSYWLPQKNRSGRFKDRADEGGSKSRNWIALHGLKESSRQFLSSSNSGELLVWDLDKEGKQKWRIFGTENQEVHCRTIFSITARPNSLHILTTSIDRQIVLWNIETETPEWNLPTIGGFVYHLAASPYDPGLVAVGGGDNVIRLWKTDSKQNSFQVTSLWQGIRSKVTALCWHPYKEGCIAFGTDDGKVGIFVNLHPNKSPVLSRTFHKKTVYSLCYGPCCSITDSSDMCIYSCGGDGIVYQHHPTSLHEEATNIDELIRQTNTIQHMLPMKTDISWRYDGVAVAIGNEDGSIDILSPTLLILCSINIHHKIINCLQWFPQTQSVDGGGMKYWLASGSNESPIHVHDLSSILGVDNPKPQATPITSSFRPLPGHIYRTTSLDWDPCGNGQLATVSYDGTAQIWDVVKATPVSNFRAHSGRLYSVIWSRQDPDLVYTGGEDFFLMSWRPSQCSYTKPPADKREISVVFYGINKKKPTKGGRKSKSFANKEQRDKISDVTSQRSATEPLVKDEPVLNSSQLMSITELLQKRKEELLSAQTNGGDVITKESIQGAEMNGSIKRESEVRIKESGNDEGRTDGTGGVMSDGHAASRGAAVSVVDDVLTLNQEKQLDKESQVEVKARTKKKKVPTATLR